MTKKHILVTINTPDELSDTHVECARCGTTADTAELLLATDCTNVLTVTGETIGAISVEPKLWCVTYEYQDGGSHNLYTVGVDMDDATAEMLVLKELNGVLDEDSLDLSDFSVGEVRFEVVPTTINGFNVTLTEGE